MTLEQIHRLVKVGWRPPYGTPLMDFIWNAALDAAAAECRSVAEDWEDVAQSETCAIRILALKK